MPKISRKKGYIMGPNLRQRVPKLGARSQIKSNSFFIRLGFTSPIWGPIRILKHVVQDFRVLGVII